MTSALANRPQHPIEAALSDMALRRADVPLVLLYGLAFALLFWAAQPWGGGGGFFSLWFPPAGLRFAVLWNRGARLTPWLIFAELCADWATGVLMLSGPDMFHAITGAMRPGIMCGATIAVVRHLAQGRSGVLALPPMTLGLAAFVAPAMNALMVILFEAFLPDGAREYRTGVDTAISLTGLAVGDLLGILVLAPLMLWLTAIVEAPDRRKLARPPLSVIFQNTLSITFILSGGLVLTTALYRAGLGTQPMPSIVAGAWIGLRHGRTAAWFAILAHVLLFLPYSALALDEAGRLDLHLDIASVVLVTWLAGSFFDAQAAAGRIIARRNRLLLQAERLKTLRSMSVAVIHEISQPLSTLAIEASHLRNATEDLGGEIAMSAALVDRKARDLSELVRRLRRFGGREVDAPAPLPVATLIQTAQQIVAGELHDRGGRLALVPVPPDLVVQAQEIELTQALVNLLRNAIAASPDGTLSISAVAEGEALHLMVENPVPKGPRPEYRRDAGMGIGVAIARAIVEAHGGTLHREDSPRAVRFTMLLPIARVSA